MTDHDTPYRHHAQDGSVYAVEIVGPHRVNDGQPYRVDLVRGYTDEHGLGREQRLHLAERDSWGEAEEVEHEVVGRLAADGLDGLTDDERSIADQPPSDEVIYITAVYPLEGEDHTAAHLLAIHEHGVATAPLAVGAREPVEDVARTVDQAFALEGAEAGLAAARAQAAGDGPLFGDGPQFRGDVPTVVADPLPDPVFDYLPDPDYSFDLYDRDEDTLELQAVKRWEADDMGYLEREGQVIESFSHEERATAEVKQDALHAVQREDGLAAAMQLAEEVAVANGELDPEREDPRLFREGPPDPFPTRREAEMAAEPDTPDWRLDPRETVTPDGEPLGVALFMTVYPDAAGDAPPPNETTRVRQLELGHFPDADAADRFADDFRGHLAPGVLDGPELAEAVAGLEGMPGGWIEMEGRELDTLTNGEATTIVRDPADWHPYNPHAEAEARIAAEGLYTDPLHAATTFDGEEDDPKVEPTAPDFDM